MSCNALFYALRVNNDITLYAFILLVFVAILVLRNYLVFKDIEAKKEAQKEKEIDEQEAHASTLHRSRTPLDKDLINTGIYESSGKQSLPLVQLVQQLLRYWSNKLKH